MDSENCIIVVFLECAAFMKAPLHLKSNPSEVKAGASLIIVMLQKQ
jgi:hypothetical protein